MNNQIDFEPKKIKFETKIVSGEYASIIWLTWNGELGEMTVRDAAYLIGGVVKEMSSDRAKVTIAKRHTETFIGLLDEVQ